MRPSRRQSRGLSLAGVVASLLLAPSVFASPEYPDEIKDDLMITGDAPPCTICHKNLAGGTSTVTKAFGLRMQKFGLVPSDPAALKIALQRDRYEPPPGDVDCDGQGDIDELIAGTDPNVGPDSKNDCAGGGTNTLTPAYGCGAHVAPTADGTAGSVAALAVVAGLAISFVRRRKG